ncbi:MAG: hypothetical protein WC760_11365 [Bacteroidia bacterium]
MKNIKDVPQKHSECKSNFDSIGIVWSFILAFGLINFSCNKDDSSSQNNSAQSVPDEYYVKYIVASSTIYSGGKLNLTLKNEKGQDVTIVINQNVQSETIIGPVSKGFNSKLKAVAAGTSYNKLKLYSEIHACKNISPFAIKGINGSDTPRDAVELNYTIDF